MKHTRFLALLAAALLLLSLLLTTGCAANKADIDYEPSIKPSEEAKGADDATAAGDSFANFGDEQMIRI